jgi:hypothetical protein
VKSVTTIVGNLKDVGGPRLLVQAADVGPSLRWAVAAVSTPTRGDAEQEVTGVEERGSLTDEDLRSRFGRGCWGTVTGCLQEHTVSLAVLIGGIRFRSS